MLILGCGNPDRSDDGAGLLTARRLRELGIEAHEHGGEPLSLMEAWRTAEEVILIDTVVSGRAAGEISVWNVRTDPLPAIRFRCSTHAVGIADAIEMARALDRLPSKLILYGIEGVEFEIGGWLSPEVADAVERLAWRIYAEHPNINSNLGRATANMAH